MQKKTTRLKTTRPQTKVNKEAFKMLATEIGLNAACRKLGVPIPTGKSWARRGGWKLPKRPGGRPQRTLEASSLHPIADALDATHKELADTARTSILQAVTNAAKLVAKKPGLDVSTVAQLRDLALALVRLCDNGKSVVPVTVNAENAQVIICDEARRAELIEQRQRLLEQEATQASGRKVEAAVPAALPAPETQSDDNVGTANGTVAQDPRPVTQSDPVFQHMQSIGKAETWIGGQDRDPADSIRADAFPEYDI
jgi:hypothetical protein